MQLDTDSLVKLQKTIDQSDEAYADVLKELILHFENSNPDSSQNYCNKLISWSENNGAAEKLAFGYLKLGTSQYRQSDYYSAINSLYTSLEYYEEIDAKKGIAECYKVIGSVHDKLANHDKSLSFFKQAQTLFNDLNEQDEVAKTHNNIGISYFNLGKHDSSIYHHDQSIAIKEQLKDTLGVAKSYLNIGVTYHMGKNEYVKAFNYYYKAHEIFEKLGVSNALAIIQTNIGTIFFDKQEYVEAERYFLKSLELSTNLNFANLTVDNHEFLTKIYSVTGEFEKALHHLNKQKDLEKQLFSVEKSNKIAELEAKYESKVKEAKISQQQTTLDNQKTLTFLISIILMLSFLSVGILVYKRKKERLTNEILERRNHQISLQQQQLEESNQYKNKIISLISHDFRSPLHSLQAVISLLKMNALTPQEQSELIEGLDSQVNSTLALIENILLWTKSQMDGLKIDARYFKLSGTVDEIIETLGMQTRIKNITIINKLPEETLVFADRESITIVIRNLISNAIKFSHPNSKIVVNGNTLNDSSLEISVIDNGVGMTKKQLEDIRSGLSTSTRGTNHEKGSGIGLTLCSEFLTKNNSELSVASEKERGSSFSFELPCIKSIANGKKVPIAC